MGVRHGHVSQLHRQLVVGACDCDLVGDVGLLRVLAELGAGFDCASTAEVAAVMALGVEPDRIVFANPCKRPNDIKCVTSAVSKNDSCKLSHCSACTPGMATCS